MGINLEATISIPVEVDVTIVAKGSERKRTYTITTTPQFRFHQQDALTLPVDDASVGVTVAVCKWDAHNPRMQYVITEELVFDEKGYEEWRDRFERDRRWAEKGS